MSELKANRAYRVTKPIDVPSGPRPNVGDVVYLESFSNGQGKMVFSTPENHVYRLPVTSAASSGLILAKFVTLPEKLKIRYRINADGKRVSFDKGQVFEVVDPSSALPVGTRMLCTTGGKDAMFSYVDHMNMGNTWQPTARDMMLLAPVEPVIDSTSEIRVSLGYSSNVYAGCRPVFQGSIALGEHKLAVERKTMTGSCVVYEKTPGALPLIESVLRENLGSCAEAKSASPRTLIEAFVQFAIFDAGARTFGQAADRLSSLINNDNLSTAMKLESRAARSNDDKRLSAHSTSHASSNTPDHKRGAYRKILQQQYGFRG